MGLFSGKFGKGRKKKIVPAGSAVSRPENLADDPNLIRVFDKYGQELFITREEWRNNTLKGNVEKAWNNPEALYSLIVQSLNDNFVEDVVAASEQLSKIDPDLSRSATVQCIVYMEMGRVDEAEEVLSGHLSKHGKNGVVMTNLAKVYSRQGLEEKSIQTLWNALETDPNQDNAVGWYEVVHREKSGEQAGRDALRRIAAIPGSWRAQLWLARASLEAGKLDAALRYYKESLANAKRPIPLDLLEQMSGDLGNNGRLREIIEWVEPAFNVEYHGLQVGNNLIKANLDLGNLDAARSILDQLYALKRPDWRETLSYWDTELGKARIGDGAPAEDPPGITMMSIDGPLWMRSGSSFKELNPVKTDGVPVIGILGSTASYAKPNDVAVTQMADTPGRLSRALPIALLEQIHFRTDAVALALIPWAQGQGFALFGKPYETEALHELVTGQKLAVDYLAYITVNTVSNPWKLKAQLMRASDGEIVGAVTAEANKNSPGAGIEEFLSKVRNLIIKWSNVHHEKTPEWYQLPRGAELADYLLRLEQLLAVNCMNLDFLEGCMLSG
jgi:tetratricopeptide (TPR) repeat protein